MKKFMKAAIVSAREGMSKGDGGPFGACLVLDGLILAVSHNTVLRRKDPTCHAEMNAIRTASSALKRFDLSGCEIYSTTEPCPMCFSAIHWAKIRKVYFGTSIADVQRRGFNELKLSAAKMRSLGQSPVMIAPVMMRGECLELLKAWDLIGNKRLY